MHAHAHSHTHILLTVPPSRAFAAGSNYGTVTVAIPQKHQSGAGRVFLVYTAPDGAARAVGALHGRRFGEAVISARLYPEELYVAAHLTA
jgi:hypothetical protein